MSLLALVLLVGLGLVVALALGWRSPTPRRPPDLTASELTWTKYGAGHQPSAGALRLRLAQPQQHAWAVAGQQVSDFELELDLRALTPSQDVGYGLLYRYQDPSNYYLFAIGGDGYYTVAVVRDGALTPLHAWSQWPHVRRGAAANRLRARCTGELCSFYVNGEFTTQITHDAFLTGDLGFWVQTFSDAVLDVVLEELRLWLLN